MAYFKADRPTGLPEVNMLHAVRLSAGQAAIYAEIATLTIIGDQGGLQPQAPSPVNPESIYRQDVLLVITPETGRAGVFVREAYEVYKAVKDKVPPGTLQLDGHETIVHEAGGLFPEQPQERVIIQNDAVQITIGGQPGGSYGSVYKLACVVDVVQET